MENAAIILFYYVKPCVFKYFRVYAVVTENRMIKDLETVKAIRSKMTKAIGILTASVLIVSVLAISPAPPLASAQAVTCGYTITESLKLTADIGPCSENGIIIGAYNITLDCNGHTVSGSGSGFGTGITIPAGISRVTIKNCEVTGFGGSGFSVFGSNNVLRGNTAENNGGAGFNIGGVDNISLQDNTATDNGGSGFSL